MIYADADAMRFIFCPMGDLEGPLKMHKMTVNYFGAASSLTNCSYAFQKNAEDHGKEFDADVVASVKEFYMDDLPKSCVDDANAIRIIQGQRELCAKGNFNLGKFICNSREVMKTMPKANWAKGIQDLDDSCQGSRCRGSHGMSKTISSASKFLLRWWGRRW